METRVLATDPASRRKFRLYWLVVSPGVRLLRRVALTRARRELEGARQVSESVLRACRFRGVALGLLLIAELTLVLWLRSLSIGESVASRDPVSGTVYILMLGVFALMPLLAARWGV
jgi:hypothetical protein